MNIDLNKLDINDEHDRAMLWGAGVQIQWHYSGDVWYEVTCGQNLFSAMIYRRKPITRTITIPQCLTEAPARGSFYWSLWGNSMNATQFKWNGSAFDNSMLLFGLCFATEGDADAFATAMKGTAK